jgi:16S rRNA G1207 methylase RsmC
VSHYFVTPAGEEHRRSIRARFWDRDWEFVTADGVFSADRLDLGTSILLRESTPPTGPVNLLDLGCGWGVIAVALAVTNPEAHVTAIDVNERALDLTRLNATLHGVADRLTVSTASEHTFDEIWSNPPIRVGKEALHALLRQWLPTLKPDGVARMVVGKNLGADSLQAWLNQSGWRCDRVASAKGFRVLEVRRA